LKTRKQEWTKDYVHATAPERNDLERHDGVLGLVASSRLASIAYWLHGMLRLI